MSPHNQADSIFLEGGGEKKKCTPSGERKKRSIHQGNAGGPEGKKSSIELRGAQGGTKKRVRFGRGGRVPVI